MALILQWYSTSINKSKKGDYSMGFLDTFGDVVHRMYEMTPEGMAKKEEELRIAEARRKAEEYNEVIRASSDRDLLERAVRSLDDLNKKIECESKSIWNSINSLESEIK